MGNEVSKKDTPITLSQILFILPLVVLLVSLVLYITSLQNSINLLNQREDTTEGNIKDIKEKLSKVDQIAVDVAQIKGALGIRASKDAGSSALLSQAPAMKQEPAVPKTQQQNQTVIEQAPQPTPPPTPTTTPAPERADPVIPASILPTISIPALGITIGGR